VLAALLAFALFATGAGKASFRYGVIGVRLSERIGEYAAWSPDGTWIAEPARVGLRLRNVTSGKIRQVRAPAFQTQSFTVPPGPLAWSPDGRAIRYATSPPIPNSSHNYASRLIEVQVDGSGIRQKTLGVRATSTDWAPQGWPLAFSAGPYALSFEKGPIGPKPSLFVVDDFGAVLRRIARIPHPVGEEELTEPVISPDGKRIAFQRWGRSNFRPGNLTIWTVGTDGSEPEPLVQGLIAAFAVEWSPDGGTIALGAHTSVRGGQHVYTVPAGGGRLRRIVDEEIFEGPAWSPDGEWLAYSTYDGKIWRVHPDGSERQMIGKVPGEQARNLLWAPDSRHLAYTAAPPPRSD
jgi:Tol biopolymer transport system component